MIEPGDILENLKIIDQKYKNSDTDKEALLYSKLAILELCGWIEESMDDIVLSCAVCHLKSEGNLNHVKNKIVNETYGFQYETHFRQMLIRLLGIINVERIEENVDQKKREKFKATLSNLKYPRNSEAHTHIKGTTRVIDAPSITLSRFESLYEGLIEFDLLPVWWTPG